MKHWSMKTAAAILSAALMLPTSAGAMNYLSPFRGYFEKIEQNRALIQALKTEVIVEAKYDEVREYHEGYAAVRVGDKWGYIDEAGNEFLAPSLAWAGDFKDGAAYILSYTGPSTNNDERPISRLTKDTVTAYNEGKRRYPDELFMNYIWYIDKDGHGVDDGVNTLWGTSADILQGMGDNGITILNGTPYSLKEQTVKGVKTLYDGELYNYEYTIPYVLIRDASKLRTYEGKEVGGYENARAIGKAVNGVIPMYAYSGISTPDVRYAKEEIPASIPEESRVFKAFYMDLDGNVTKVFPYNPKAYYLVDENGDYEDTGERSILFVSAPQEGLTDAEVGFVGYFPDGNIKTKTTGEGLLNEKDEWVIAPEAGYRIATYNNDFVFDGVIVVVDLKSNLMGLFDINGKEILPAKYTKITNFVNGFAYAEKTERCSSSI